MTFSTGTLSALNAVLADLNTPNPLGRTALIDYDHPLVRETAREIAGDGDEQARVRRLHDHVRDAIRFGFSPHPWRMKASEVLAARAGHAVPKATLFTALLRASGVPARMRFVSVDASLWSGLLDLPCPRIDHAVVEVWLRERWLACDSFVVDEVYFNAAKRRLRKERRPWGHGIHTDGRVWWSPRAPSFSQLVTGGPHALPAAFDLGVRADARALYKAAPPESSPPPVSVRLRWRLMARAANQRIEGLLADSEAPAPVPV